MAYESVKNQIDAYIKANGVNLITGPVLNAVLTTMLDELGEGYAFQGVLDTTDTPSPAADIPQAWLASAGTYLGGSITVDEGELALIIHTADGWSKETVYRGVQLSHDAILDALGYTPADEADLAEKQDTIADLSAIRSGAAAGATAVQPAALNAKQDTISDLSSIRSGAALGSTSVQPADIENMVEAEPIGSIIPPVNPSEFATKEEVSQLGQKVNGAEVPLFEVGEYDNWTTGRYLVASSGSPNTSSVNSITDYIDITGYQQIKTIVNRSVTYDSTGIVCFYDSEKQYLNATIFGDVGERGHKDIISEIPVGAKYIRCTCFDTELSSWYLTGIVKAKDYLTEEAVGASIGYLTTDRMVIGYYRKSSDGNPAVMSSAAYSIPIAVSAGDRIVLSNSGVLSAYALITRVTETGEAISVIQAGLSEDSSLKDYNILIDFDGFISVSCNELTVKRIVLYKAGIYDIVARQVSQYDTRILAVETETNRLADIVAPAPIQLTEDDVIEGKYRNVSGNLSTLSVYIYSVPILVKQGTRIITTEAVNIPSSVSVITKVDAENNYIETLVAGTNESTTYDYTIQEDCYIGISCLESYYPLFRIITPNIKNQLDNISANGISVESKTKLLALNAENPLAVILRECGYGCLLKTWGFIGDSYTSGETPAYDGSTMKYLDCYKWSWGQQFMKIIGSEGYNFSNGGQTAKGWIRSQGTVHDESYYGGVGGGDWRQAQVDLKQGYIISLGINDNGHFGQTYLGATYSLGDVTTDVNVSDYSQNNENTFAGCYAGIIQRILSVSPKAKIFCLTQFQDTLEQVNDVVREIVALFPNNVFLIDLHDYALNIVDEQYYMSNGHPSPLGYAYMAYCINTYVDYIIRNNKQKFMDVTLIGSNYTL